jgi:hypothetical protein
MYLPIKDKAEVFVCNFLKQYKYYIEYNRLGIDKY